MFFRFTIDIIFTALVVLITAYTSIKNQTNVMRTVLILIFCAI